MDTTEVYIKMCDCPEIQVLRDIGSWQNGDFIGDRVDNHYSVHHRGNDAWADVKPWIKHRIEWVWLPRQDQLQEMVNLAGREFCFRNEWTNDESYNDELASKTMVWRGESCSWVVHAKSMEQLWLAFCMSEKFNKIWDGGEWVTG